MTDAQIVIGFAAIAGGPVLLICVVGMVLGIRDAVRGVGPAPRSQMRKHWAPPVVRERSAFCATDLRPGGIIHVGCGELASGGWGWSGSGGRVQSFIPAGDDVFRNIVRSDGDAR